MHSNGGRFVSARHYKHIKAILCGTVNYQVSVVMVKAHEVESQRAVERGFFSDY